MSGSGVGGLIVHEWLEQRGGSERVVDALRDVFPDADLLALWNDDPARYPDARETWIARTPLRRYKALALPFEPPTWRGTRGAVGEYEWALISSHLFAHHVNVRNRHGNRVPKYVYAHTPARYLWEPQIDGRGNSPLVKTVAAALKPLDRRRADEPVAIAANSHFVRERIGRTWDREATVIYPPVQVEHIQSVKDWRTKLSGDEMAVIDQLPDTFILGASRFIPYKRLDWVIRAGESVGLPVVIAGSGPQEAALRDLAARAQVPVSFIIHPSTPLLYALYQTATLFVFPPVEDFGIMPVESLACGTPVVTTSCGGALESVVDGRTGILSHADRPEELAIATKKALDLSDFVGEAKSSARRFGASRFESAIRKWLSS